jgi:hypothetical protein
MNNLAAKRCTLTVPKKPVYVPRTRDYDQASLRLCASPLETAAISLAGTLPASKENPDESNFRQIRLQQG